MANLVGKKKKWLAYVIYGILLTIGLLYYRFPSEAVEEYLQARAQRVDPRLSFSADKISPSPTFGLKFLAPALSLRASPGKALVKADSFSIRPVLSSFLRDKRRFCFDSKAYQGVLDGCIDVSKNNSKSPISTSVTVKDIRMPEDGPIKSAIGRNLVGDLDGTVNYDGPTESLMNGNGQANLRLSNGRIELLQPILSLESIDFNEISMKMVLKNRKIDINSIELKARNMHATLSGIISLKKDLFESTLDMKGAIEPSGEFFKSLTGSTHTMKLFQTQLKRGKITFIIRGTLADPKFRFI